jgi:hypothetical protein
MLQTLNKLLHPVGDSVEHFLFPRIFQSDKSPIADLLMHTDENLCQMKRFNQLRARGICRPGSKIGILQHLTHVSLLLQSACPSPEDDRIREEMGKTGIEVNPRSQFMYTFDDNSSV